MLKAQYEQRGPVPNESIQPVEFEKPVLADGQVLIEVLAAPINPSDVLTLTGEYGILPPLPAVGGNEGVGKIVEHGPGVEQPAVGQTVLLPVGIGTWSTHVVAPAAGLVPLPNEADPKQLSMVTVNPPTASLLLSQFADLKEGDWVIQNAANSGVGSYVIQLAKIRGYKTINVVRRESAIDGVKKVGGDAVLVDSEDLPAQVEEITGGANLKLAIDAVGGGATGRLASCLKGGTVVNYGALSGEPCAVSPKSLIFENVDLKGFWLSKWFQDASEQDKMSVYGELIQLIATGKLNTEIHATYTVEQIKEAVAVAAEGGRHGKILIVPNG